MKIYLVGGAVRDEILSLPYTEKDYVVVGSTAKEMLENNFIKVGKDFPVFLHPKTKEEYALARTEKKVGKGYYGFECNASKTVTLKEDLSRRDITINAMAKDENGNVIDYFNGQKDLEKKIIRHVTDAFTEDPVRILRVARFKAKLHHLGFIIADDTQKLMQQMVDAGELSDVTRERVWLEIYKALAEKNPQEFFLTLKECGALKIIFPALNKLFSIKQGHRHLGQDAGTHTMTALRESVFLTDPKEELDIRFAVLCHDLGKGVVSNEEVISNNEHPVNYRVNEQDVSSEDHEQIKKQNKKTDNHDILGVTPIKEWCKKYRVPNSFRDLAVNVSKYHIKMFQIINSPEILLEILEGLDAFRKPERVKKFAIACFADVRGMAINRQHLNSENSKVKNNLKISVRVSAAETFDKTSDNITNRAEIINYYENYPQVKLLQKAHAKLMKMDTKDLQDKNLHGQEFKLELTKLRLEVIKKMIDMD